MSHFFILKIESRSHKPGQLFGMPKYQSDLDQAVRAVHAGSISFSIFRFMAVRKILSQSDPSKHNLHW